MIEEGRRKNGKFAASVGRKNNVRVSRLSHAPFNQYRGGGTDRWLIDGWMAPWQACSAVFDYLLLLCAGEHRSPWGPFPAAWVTHDLAMAWSLADALPTTPRSALILINFLYWKSNQPVHVAGSTHFVKKQSIWRLKLSDEASVAIEREPLFFFSLSPAPRQQTCRELCPFLLSSAKSPSTCWILEAHVLRNVQQ